MDFITELTTVANAEWLEVLDNLFADEIFFDNISHMDDCAPGRIMYNTIHEIRSDLDIWVGHGATKLVMGRPSCSTVICVPLAVWGDVEYGADACAREVELYSCAVEEGVSKYLSPIIKLKSFDGVPVYAKPFCEMGDDFVTDTIVNWAMCNDLIEDNDYSYYGSGSTESVMDFIVSQWDDAREFCDTHHIDDVHAGNIGMFVSPWSKYYDNFVIVDYAGYTAFTQLINGAFDNF